MCTTIIRLYFGPHSTIHESFGEPSFPRENNRCVMRVRRYSIAPNLFAGTAYTLLVFLLFTPLMYTLKSFTPIDNPPAVGHEHQRLHFSFLHTSSLPILPPFRVNWQVASPRVSTQFVLSIKSAFVSCRSSSSPKVHYKITAADTVLAVFA